MRNDRFRAMMVALLAALPLSAGCVSTPANKLTEGMVKTHLCKGCTSQAEVLCTFGPPDQVTHNGGLQMWVYERTVVDRDVSSGYVNVVVAGVGGRHERSTSSSTMLIVYFDDCDTVIDYRLHKAKF